MPQVGDRVILTLPGDDEIECSVKAVSGDLVEIQWPQDRDEGGWWTSRSMMSRNADGSWNAMVPAGPDGIHPANRLR